MNFPRASGLAAGLILLAAASLVSAPAFAACGAAPTAATSDSLLRLNATGAWLGAVVDAERGDGGAIVAGCDDHQRRRGDGGQDSERVRWFADRHGGQRGGAGDLADDCRADADGHDGGSQPDPIGNEYVDSGIGLHDDRQSEQRQSGDDHGGTLQTSRVCAGVLVPMPTLPVESTNNRKAPAALS